MQPEQHLKRAVHHLDSARLTMEAGYFDVTVNRAYYAAFEAARAEFLPEFDLRAEGGVPPSP